MTSGGDGAARVDFSLDGDKLADKLPMWLWPKVRILYYVFSGGFLMFVAIGLVAVMLVPTVVKRRSKGDVPNTPRSRTPRDRTRLAEPRSE